MTPETIATQPQLAPPHRNPPVATGAGVLPFSPRTGLIGILLAGALLRALLIAWVWYEPIHIGDEFSYDDLAASIATTGEFNEAGAPTAIRPPLYPAFVAAIYSVAGEHNYNAVRIVQAFLGLAVTVLVYLLACRLYDSITGLWAALLTCFYPSLLLFGNLVLTEVFFALLVAAFFLANDLAVSKRSYGWLVAVGVLLGLGALTRSVLALFPPVMFLYVAWAWRGASLGKRLLAGIVPTAVALLVILPWSIRSTRLEKTFTLVDSMGGRNAMMGNYEHTPLYRAWDAVAFHDERGWYVMLATENPGFYELTQGQRDKLAMKRALAYMKEHPGQTAARSAIKCGQFWQLERTIVAGLTRGWWGELPSWAILLLALSIMGTYASNLLLAIDGAVLVPESDRRHTVLAVLFIGFIWAVHTVVFAHERYHLSLMPVLLIWSGAAIAHRREIWRQFGSWKFWLVAAIGVAMVALWICEIVIVEREALGKVLH